MRNRPLLAALLAAATAASMAAAWQAADAAPRYRNALPGYRFEFPRDHFDHPDFQTEWWYYTGNLRARDGRRFGFELTFFRQAVDRTDRPHDSPWAVRDVYLAHLALSDVDGRAFLHEERVNRAGPGLAGVNPEAGVIWNGNWSVELSETRQALRAVADRFDLRLSLNPAKPPVVNGVNGVSQKAAGAGQASHYVSLTRLGAAGRLEFDGRQYDVEGSAWMDHEFFTNQLGRNQRGWDWLSLQFDDGTELMVYRLRRTDGSVDPFSAGTFVARDGRSHHLRAGDFTMVPTGETWSSPRTRAIYPIAWRVTVPARGLDFAVRAALAEQELVGKTGLTPAYWEGSVGATGRQGGTPRAGVGYLEMTGYDKAVALGPR